ncbi:hypothetical protein TEQG_06183 [Trichophyton equinum CBS 127.97]|uniref:Uncharacterized protein n=1 Tax=Trichophyton equinum (strain ATCC MYA-4606 / CBS 127.97) TaxID=559882 RepID=F2PZF6_TRIEC|nr:hypothetical protein TEQG_06183 [Trichophyton equinum CBS 127.97]
MTIPKGGRDEKEATSTSHGRVSHEGERAEPLDGQSSERYLQPGDRWTMDDEMTIILTIRLPEIDCDETNEVRGDGRWPVIDDKPTAKQAAGLPQQPPSAAFAG